MRTAIFLSTLLLAWPSRGDTPDTVFLDELTWTEVRDAIASGTTTLIVATAGTEQNGPHLTLAKHRVTIQAAADGIARELGNALVAPIINYVPEGGIDPPTGAMRYPGTLSLPNVYFMKVLEYAARSSRVHGFTDIVFIGDSGGNQKGMREVSEALNEEWRGDKTRVHFIAEYYSDNGFTEWLESQGEELEAIGRHAGIAGTSQVLAFAPEHVRMDKLAPNGGFEGSGVTGDPSRATVDYGKKLIELKVDVSVRRIKELIAAER